MEVVEDSAALPAAIDMKLLARQNQALKRQLETRRGEAERLKTELSKCEKARQAAETVARAAMKRVDEEQLQELLDAEFEGNEDWVKQLMGGDAKDLEVARNLQLKNEAARLSEEMERLRIEVQRLNIKGAFNEVDARLKGTLTGSGHATTTTPSSKEGISAEDRSQIASLKAELCWRRFEGYASMVHCLEAVHADRNFWRSKSSELDEALNCTRRETSEALAATMADFQQAVTSFQLEISAIAAALAAAETEKEAAASASEAAAAKLDLLASELEASNGSVAFLREELDLVKHELHLTQERCEKLQAEVDAKLPSVPSEEEVGEWQKKYRELRLKFDAEVDYRTKLKEANLRLKARLTENPQERQLERLNEVLRQKDEAHNKLLSAHLQLQQQLRLLKEREEAVVQRQAVVEAALARMHAENSTLNAHLHTGESVCREKEQELQQLRLARENLARQLTASQTSNSQLENALAKLKMAFEELEADLKEAFGRSNELAKQVQRLKQEDQDIVKLQLEEFRAMVKCSLCNEHFKDVMLTKCSHCFCRSCVNDNLLNARNRKCPLCGTRFAESDVKPVHLSSC